MNEEVNKKANSKPDTANEVKPFTLTEFSRETGIRLELLRRTINRHTRQVRAETWDKFYPSLMELFGENASPYSKRIGPPYRRHAELVEMFSDQKILLDVFNILGSADQQKIIEKWCAMTESTPTSFVSLSADENKLMGAFLAMEEDIRQHELLELIKNGRNIIKAQR